MVYCFTSAESVPEAARRIVRECVSDARSRLQGDAGSGDTAVHESRKRIKEIRAVLRLVRGDLGQDFERENRFFRDTARGLAATRDAEATVESLDKLVTHFPERFGGEDLEAVRGRLLERCASARALGGSAVSPAGLACERLEAAHERVAHWPLRRQGFGALRDGVKRVYGDGRHAYRAAGSATADDEVRHQWRKRVKDLWYHTILLQPAWDQALAAQRATLKQLSDTLGDDHDLAMLRLLMKGEPSLFGDRSLRRRLGRAADHRQAELRATALDLGRRIYAEKPGAYRRRVRAYWKAWRCRRAPDAVSWTNAEKGIGHGSGR